MFPFNVMAQNTFVKQNLENTMENLAIECNREDVLYFYKYQSPN